VKESPTYAGEALRLTVPFLPQTYIFSNGLETIIRMMEDNEAEQCYALWKTAAEKGLM